MNQILFISILNESAFHGSRVAVSLYALELGASQFTIGILVALFALCPVLLSIAIGRFADRVSPRLPVVLGTAGMAAALLLPPLFSSLTALYAASFLMGLAHQLYLIPLEAVIGVVDGAKNRARNYALITMGFSVASFSGPLVTGFSIDYLGHRQAFLVLTALTVMPLLMLAIRSTFLPKTVQRSPTARHGSVLDLWRLRSLRTTLIAGSIALSAWDLFNFYLPIYGHSIGLSASAIGSILAVVSISSFIVRGGIPFLVKKLTEAEILAYSIFAAAVAFALFPFLSNPYALAAIAFLIGLGVGCATPIAMSFIYVLTPPGRIAESMGLRKTVNHATHLLIPLIFGSVGTAFGFVTVFASNSIILAAAGFLVRKAGLRNSDPGPKQAP